MPVQSLRQKPLDPGHGLAGSSGFPTSSNYLAVSIPPLAELHRESSFGGSPHPSTQLHNHGQPRTTTRGYPRLTGGSDHGHARTSGRGQGFHEPDAEKGFGLRAASRRRDSDQLTFTIGCERKAGPDIVSGEVWKVRKNLVLRHTRGQVLKYVVHGDSQTSYTRLTTTLSRLYGDEAFIIEHLDLCAWSVDLTKRTVLETPTHVNCVTISLMSSGNGYNCIPPLVFEDLTVPRGTEGPRAGPCRATSCSTCARWKPGALTFRVYGGRVAQGKGPLRAAGGPSSSPLLRHLIAPATRRAA